MIPVLGFLYPGTSPSNRFDECSSPQDGVCRVHLRDWPCNSYTRSSREQWEIHHPDLRYFLPPFQHLVDHLPWVSQWGFKLWLWILAPYSVTPELITLSSHSLIASLRQETGIFFCFFPLNQLSPMESISKTPPSHLSCCPCPCVVFRSTWLISAAPDCACLLQFLLYSLPGIFLHILLCSLPHFPVLLPFLLKTHFH